MMSSKAKPGGRGRGRGGGKHGGYIGGTHVPFPTPYFQGQHVSMIGVSNTPTATSTTATATATTTTTATTGSSMALSNVSAILNHASTQKVTPSPVFPERPLPIPSNDSVMRDEERSLLMIHKTLVKMIENSVYFLQQKKEDHAIESAQYNDVDYLDGIQRYSDKYKKSKPSHRIHDIKTDTNVIPDELMTVYKPDKARSVKTTLHAVNLLDLLKLDELEKQELLQPIEIEQKENGKGQEDTENDLNDEEEQEEEIEEETDYNLTYFDPGDDDHDYDDGGGGEDYY